MKGKILMGGMLGFTAIFAGALWYFQNYAYYDVDETDDFIIQLTLVGGAGMQDIPASNFKILSSETSPLKFRACFTVENSIPMLTETFIVYEDATPLLPPSWFTCFDTVAITEDLDTGEAVAFLSAKDVSQGVDRIVAVYGDGRAYSWHQLNEKYTD